MGRRTPRERRPPRRAGPAGRRRARSALGALAVAAAAQVAVPVPFSPVPMTLQPLAVLAVGGVLGARRRRRGARDVSRARDRSGCRSSPAARRACCTCSGPTGGYLLAFPVAAGVTGALGAADRPACSACCCLRARHGR